MDARLKYLLESLQGVGGLAPGLADSLGEAGLHSRQQSFQRLLGGSPCFCVNARALADEIIQ